jgi:phosphoribosylformylglycinamidine (FGAM) synthase-like enzyme
VAPFPGAETGAGGRIRDTHATGIGSLVGAATAGYCVGNLQMENSFAPWEDSSFTYPPNLASPLQVLSYFSEFLCSILLQFPWKPHTQVAVDPFKDLKEGHL